MPNLSLVTHSVGPTQVRTTCLTIVEMIGDRIACLAVSVWRTKVGTSRTNRNVKVTFPCTLIPDRRLVAEVPTKYVKISIIA